MTVASCLAMDAARTRRFSWGDPFALAAAAEDKTGLAFLRGIAERRLPLAPMMDALSLELTEVDNGRAVFECEVKEMHYNLIGSVHGGFAATLLDSATGCAVYSTLGVGDRWTTLGLQVDYLRPLSVDSGRVRCEAEVVRVGRRVGLADGRLTDAEGRLVARGQSTCLVIRAR